MWLPARMACLRSPGNPERPNTMRRSSKTGHVQTLARGLAVVETLYGHEEGLSLHELSERLKCPKPSLLRLLDTLLDRGYLRLDEATGRYALDALHLLRASNLYRPASGRCAAIRRVLEDLTRRTGETAVLAVIDPRSGTVASVDHVEPSHIVRAVPPVFRPLPALRASLGRAWLARLSDAEAAESASRWAAAMGAPQDEADRILADLDVVRAQGYAVTIGSAEPDLVAVSQVVVNAEGRAFGGAAVLAPACRMTPDRLEEIGRAVCAAARMLSNLFARDPVAVDIPAEPQLAGAAQ